MALSQRAHTPLPALTYGNPPIAIQITCHIAVWYWAAQEAQARGLTNAKAPEATLRRIVNMPGGPQGAMMAVPAGAALRRIHRAERGPRLQPGYPVRDGGRRARLRALPSREPRPGPARRIRHS